MPLFLQTSLGGGVGRLKLEALREEMHCFGENHDIHSCRTLNRLRCSAAMRNLHDFNEREISKLGASRRSRHKNARIISGRIVIHLDLKTVA